MITKENVQKYIFTLILYFVSFVVVADNFYFTDTYGNKIDYIYNDTNNYLSIHKYNEDDLSVIDIKCYQNHSVCLYNQTVNEIIIYTNILPPDLVFIYIETNNGLDSIPLKVIEPFYRFNISIVKELSNTDTLTLKYGKSIFIDLQIEEKYKFITKFEDNIYLLSSIFWDNDKYPVIVKRESYNRYELIFPYDIFGYKRMIESPVNLVVYPYRLINKTKPSPISHKSVSYIVKIE